ncbi:MAG: prephenate dehydratase [Chloroflexi bacterium]|nr:prephenate dehydratase [Chloroflexota bacterium]
MKVAFQGERGAYSEAASIAHFGEGIEPVPCESFDEVFASVESGAADRGAAPIENSLAGSIHRNYDLLLRHNLHIVGEKIFRVRHCLIAQPGAAMADIRRVSSHPQALAQCEHYIKRLGASIEPAYDTAGAVKLLKESGRRDAAAIASRRAAEVWGMQILEEGIEDDAANFTRFLILSRQPEPTTQPSKTSIVFSVRNVPGALFKALSVFALRDLDLTKIESRPIPGKTWEYMFYLDFAGNASEPVVVRALDHLREIATELRVLGSYPRDLSDAVS